MDKIKELPDNSIDIESDNIIKRYQRRPKQMENVCLADFVAWYNCKSESIMNRDTLKQVHLVQMIIFQRVLLMII